METPADQKLTAEILSEAIELLEGMTLKMGMFERHRYTGLKRRYDQHAALNERLRHSLNDIETR